MALPGTEELKNIFPLDRADKIDKKESEGNPFLLPYNTTFNIPPFEKIKSRHYIPAFKEGIKRQQDEIGAIVNNPAPPGFANTVEALESSGSPLKEVKNVFEVLKAAHSSERLQVIAREVSALLAKHRDDILFNEKLFRRIKTVYDKKEELNLSEEQAMLLEDYYKEFVRSGADLGAEKQNRLREINEELSLLAVSFENNILNETDNFTLLVRDPQDLAGLPKAVIHTAAETAGKMGKPGKWVFTLHSSMVIPFLQYSEKHRLRERIFKAFINCGNNGNTFDNKENIARIISLRAEKAKLLGYKNHAEYFLERSMAGEPDNVYHLLYRLWKPMLEIAKNEARELQALIDKEGGNFRLQPWDWWYYAEKLKKQKFHLNDQMLRRYFQLEHVRDGVFYVAGKLWGLKFIERTDLPQYHRDLQVFEVQEADGTHVGILYFDFYLRPGKMSGAWMNALRKQSKKQGRRISAVVTNNTNFHKPTKHKPSLLNLEEVKTLFHEFGHALHELLSDCTYERLSGTAVPNDFVELPSQIMENWSIEPEVLRVFARHYKTGEIIPQKLIDKIYESRNFNLGFAYVEYLAASFLDMDWHTVEEPVKIDVGKYEAASLSKIGLISEIVVRYRSTYFGHIFGGGYSASYYSYLWAEVLEAHAFEAFKEAGIFDRKVALSFRANILEKGYSADPKVLYKRFREADPDIEALLRRSGLSKKPRRQRKQSLPDDTKPETVHIKVKKRYF